MWRGHPQLPGANLERHVVAGQGQEPVDTPSYRAYELDENGHVVNFTVIPETTDDEAIAHMEKIADGRSMELWDRGRLVSRI